MGAKRPLSAFLAFGDERLTYNEITVNSFRFAARKHASAKAKTQAESRTHMVLSLGSDHAGFEQKNQLADFLIELGYDVIDRGPETDDRVDYPDYAERVARDVAGGVAEYGVLVCGTGIGMAIAADKVPGIRAANIITPEFAALAREHNNANIITLSGRFVDLDTNKNILRTFLATDFGGGRHAQRVEKIMALDTLSA